MKKIPAFLLAATMTLGLGACTPPAEPNPPAPQTETERTEDVEAMVAPIDSLARCMLENDMAYDPQNPEFFWTALFYFVGGYGTNHPLIETEEDYRLKIPRKAMQEHASVLFSDYDDFPEVPYELADRITYDDRWDAYTMTTGDIGLSETRLTNITSTETGYSLTAELWETDEDPSLIAAWEVALVKNPYADSISDPLYLYSISAMERIDENAPTQAAETATAVFNGFSDSHTAEVTMPDGSVSVFQFAHDSAVEEALQALAEGDGFTFRYVTNGDTAKIISVK